MKLSLLELIKFFDVDKDTLLSLAIIFLLQSYYMTIDNVAPLLLFNNIFSITKSFISITYYKDSIKLIKEL